MDKFLLVANWKANSSKFASLPIPENIEAAIAAPYPLISSIPQGFTKASQDVSAYPTGAYTGEVPAALLASLGVKYCLVGHSERRKYLGEGSREVEAKLREAIKSNLLPILCAQDLAEIPENIRNFEEGRYLIMYEPFSAISTQGQYHSENSEKVLATLLDWRVRLNLTCRLLYGGSINPDNVLDFRTKEMQTVISGFVVGHASLDQGTFSDIIKKCSID